MGLKHTKEDKYAKGYLDGFHEGILVGRSRNTHISSHVMGIVTLSKPYCQKIDSTSESEGYQIDLSDVYSPHGTDSGHERTWEPDNSVEMTVLLNGKPDLISTITGVNYGTFVFSVSDPVEICLKAGVTNIYYAL